ncbi:MAG: hypothetical protein ABIH39_03840 [Candidatus Margulisiibacteriota bacterium]
MAMPFNIVSYYSRPHTEHTKTCFVSSLSESLADSAEKIKQGQLAQPFNPETYLQGLIKSLTHTKYLTYSIIAAKKDLKLKDKVLLLYYIADKLGVLYTDINTDEKFNARVEVFQKEKGLHHDGRAGGGTLKALIKTKSEICLIRQAETPPTQPDEPAPAYEYTINIYLQDTGSMPDLMLSDVQKQFHYIRSNALDNMPIIIHENHQQKIIQSIYPPEKLPDFPVFIDAYTPEPLSPRITAFLDAISSAEITYHRQHRFHTIAGHKYQHDLNKHPNRTVKINMKSIGKSLYSTAAGSLQINYKTWCRYALKLGLLDFSPESQYAAGWAMAQDKGVTEEMLKKDPKSAFHIVSEIWASIPAKNGESVYNQPVKNIEYLLRKYKWYYYRNMAANKSKAGPS